MYVFIIFTILTNVCWADDEVRWDSLRVTWGRGLMPNEFDKMPLTVQEATTADFIELPGECEEGRFVGYRYIKGKDTGIILLYDANGYIAGVQTAIPANDANKVNTDYSYLKTPSFQQDSVAGIDVLVLTTYIVNPSKICNGGRTQAEFERGVAEGLWIQNGSDPIDDSFVVVTEEEDIGSTKWTKGGCFPTMGNHYWYNVRRNMDCKEHFPFFLMFNKKKLTGYGFCNIGNFTFTQRYEHPPREAIAVFLAQRVPCYSEEFERAEGFSTFHIYLVDNPAILAC